MRFQFSTYPRLLTVLFIFFYLPLTTTLVTAQDEPPAPQFLYRSENRLILLDGYTGESTELPIEVIERDRFAWSPDGQYLLTRLQQGETPRYCLNLFDVDAQVWRYSEPISCDVWDSIFSSDSTRIVYASTDGNNGTLWLYSLADETNIELYQTTEGSETNPSGISEIRWSPTETYLTFVSYHWIMGGTLNSFAVVKMESRNYFFIQGANPYYAFYSPIWSEDDGWFLITLQEQYVTSGTLPVTNHRGDVYLVNCETGEQYRLTYTPAVSEYDVRWTDEGNIAFTEVIEHEMTFTLEQAMNVEVVPKEAIVMPEPVSQEYYYDPLSDVMISPDKSLGAWTSSTLTEEGEYKYELNIGAFYPPRTAYFSVSIPESFREDNTLIGWRPSDYLYPQG